MNFFHLKLLTLFVTTFSFAQRPSPEWRFIKEVEGVKVYYRESQDSNIKEVKMQTTFNANLSSIVECLKDVDNYPKWVYKATYSKMLLKYNDNDVVYYNYIDFPWPMQDRDIAVQSRISQDAKTRVVTSESFAKWDAEPFKKDVVRIQEFKSKWTLTPIADGKVWGEYVFRSNPGGNIPTLLINSSLAEGPLRTLKGFKNLLQDAKYKKVDNGFKD
jgi:hypothetical protein